MKTLKSVNIGLVVLVGFFLLTASFSKAHQINYEPEIVKECCGCCCGITSQADRQASHADHVNCQCRVEKTDPPTEIPLDMQISNYNPNLSAGFIGYQVDSEIENIKTTVIFEPVIIFNDSGPPLFIINSSFLI